MATTADGFYDPGSGQIQTSPGTPGHTYDYQSLISNDPGFLSAQANGRQAIGDAGSARKAAVDQSVIRYGGLPSGFTDKYGDVSPDILDSAKGNQFSTLANLARNYTQSQDTFKKGLSARGALQSGDLGYGLDQLNNQYGQQQYDAGNAFGDQYTAAGSAYLNAVQQAQRDQVNAYFAAEGDIMNNPAYASTPGTPPTTANFDLSNSIVAGQPVYSDGNGNYYDANGNTINPFAPPAYSGPPVGVPTGTGSYVPNVPGSTYSPPASTPTSTSTPAPSAPSDSTSIYGMQYQ